MPFLLTFHFCLLNTFMSTFSSGVQVWAASMGQHNNVTPEQDCFARLISLFTICSICGMKAVTFLRSQLEISVCPPCLSLPAPNLYKHQPYHRYLQPYLCLTEPEGCRGHYMSSVLKLQNITSCVSHGLKMWWFNSLQTKSHCVISRSLHGGS